MAKNRPSGGPKDSAGHPGEVTETLSANGVGGGTMTMQRELVDPGKGNRVYEYWYAYQRVGHRLYKAYVGSEYDEKKGCTRLRAKMKARPPC